MQKRGGLTNNYAVIVPSQVDCSLGRLEPQVRPYIAMITWPCHDTLMTTFERDPGIA